MKLRQAKQAIRSFIRENWSDEKLCAVYAFNADSKMSFFRNCTCIMGVTLAKTLHECASWECPEVNRNHCHDARCLLGGRFAEAAYLELGYLTIYSNDDLTLRRIRLSAILRAELRRRATLSPTAAIEAVGARELTEATCR